MMIASSFFSGALDFHNKILQRILIVGLGGGVINNYMTTMKNQKFDITVVDIDPIMKTIARKWYDLEESSSHHVIIDDGLHHIAAEAHSGNRNTMKKYDVVLLDACYNDKRDLMCPLEEFLEDQNIMTIKRIVKHGGAVIINIITSKNATKEAERVNFYYSLYFPSCYLMQYSEHDRVYN
uniref:PABS domain-containing protein n=1 Tax=Heterorhabditis bacteriophora TaxID=37862 RepID=A0A1I7WK78_HETBA